MRSVRDLRAAIATLQKAEAKGVFPTWEVQWYVRGARGSEPVAITIDHVHALQYRWPLGPLTLTPKAIVAKYWASVRDGQNLMLLPLEAWRADVTYGNLPGLGARSRVTLDFYDGHHGVSLTIRGELRITEEKQ